MKTVHQRERSNTSHKVESDDEERIKPIQHQPYSLDFAMASNKGGRSTPANDREKSKKRRVHSGN